MRTDRLLAVAALCALAALALLAAGCGGGGTTTVIEKTVTETTPSGGGGENASASEGASGEGDSGEGVSGGGDSGEAASRGGDSGGGDSAGGAKPTHVVALHIFSSPTGNIGCAMYEGGARCDIRKRQWKPPPHPASCSQEVDFGQGLEVSRSGKAGFVCAGDTTLDPSASPLQYGSGSAIGGTECVSHRAGMTCTNATGHGFFISVQSYRLF